jgi:hypothetical protein
MSESFNTKLKPAYAGQQVKELRVLKNPVKKLITIVFTCGLKNVKSLNISLPLKLD